MKRPLPVPFWISSLSSPLPSTSSLQERISSLFSPEFLYESLSKAPWNFRDRTLTIEIMLFSMIYLVMNRLTSFLSIIDRLRSGDVPGISAIQFKNQSFYDRLKNIPNAMFIQVLCDVSKSISASSRHYRRIWIEKMVPFAEHIYAIDDTTLDEILRRNKFKEINGKSSQINLGGRLACALDLVTCQFAGILYTTNSTENEKAHVRPLLEGLGAGNMYIFDLGYFSFQFFDYLTERHSYFISRLKDKITYKTIYTLAENSNYRDRVVYLGKYRSDQGAYPVRLVEILIENKWYAYVTNVLSPKKLNAGSIFVLYKQRWNIEMTFAAIKKGLGMSFIHLSHINGVLIQIWSTLITYQILQDLRLEIAYRSGWKEDDVSWEILIKRIGWYVERPREESLREWLVTNGEKLSIKKRGVRERGIKEVPSEIRKEIEKAEECEKEELLQARPARQGDPSQTEPSLFLLVLLN